MPTQRKTFLGIAVFFFVCGFLAYTEYRALAYVEPLKIPPYTKTERIVDKSTGQEVILQTFVRADGSMAERSAFTTNIWNLTERTETVLDHLTRTYMVAPLTARGIPQYLQRDPDCASYFKGKLEARVTCAVSGQEKFGYPTVKVVLQRTLPDGRSISKVIYSIRELAWLPVRTEEYHSNGELAGVRDTVFLKVGEPDETEFHIAADYRRIATFVDFARVTKEARGVVLSEADIQLQTRKWSNVVAEARAEGDTRFR